MKINPDDSGWWRRILCAISGHKNHEEYGFTNNYDGGYIWESYRRCSCGRGWWD